MNITVMLHISIKYITLYSPIPGSIKLSGPEIMIIHTRSVRKVSDRIFLCEHLMDYNLARLHEPTLNLSAHA
jgi:hypothetical protein